MKQIVSKCPNCHHETMGKIWECPACGGEIPANQQFSSLKCPRCEIELEEDQFNEIGILICSKCNGMFISIETFRRITTECDVYRDESVEPVYVRGPAPPAEKYLKCCNCGELMNRNNFGKISGIMIDVCRDCGYWLDADELKRIRSFIAAGGLGKVQDKELIKQAGQLDSLKTRVSDLEFIDEMLHRYKIKRWFFKQF